MQISSPFNLEVKRIRIFSFIYGLILVVTISSAVLSRKLQNQTDKFQHPWYQTWFYCLAKFLCIIVTLHPDYNSSCGLSPPNVLFPVSAAAFVSASNKDNNDKQTQNEQDIEHDNEQDIEMDESIPDNEQDIKNDDANENENENENEKTKHRIKKNILVRKYDKTKNSKNVIDMRPIKREFTCNMFIKQQLIYFAFSVLCVIGELFLNISLYYIGSSLYEMLLCILIIFGSLFKCQSISRIYHLVGLLFLFVGFIIISLSCFAEMKDLNYKTNEIIFGILTLCIGCLFISLYLTFYQYLYEQWNLYWRLCLTLKNQPIALSGVQPDKRENITKLYIKFNNVRLEQETKLIFIHWNHIKFIFMEGIYGLIITSIIIIIMSIISNNKINNINRIIKILFYDNLNDFIQCLQSNILYYILIFIFIISVIFYEIILEDSRYHLSSYHSRIIYVLTIIFIWCCNLLIHYFVSTTYDNDQYESKYGEILSWYNLIELMGLLFIIGGLLVHDDKYVVFINKLIEHNDTIKEQYKLFKLHEYWNNIYFTREKSRLLGHSPNYLIPGYQSDTEYSIISKSMTHTLSNTYYHIDNTLSNNNEKEEQCLSIQTRDDGNLKGAMHLLLGKDMNDSYYNKPSKYYPAFYE